MNKKIKYKLVDTAGQITAVVIDAIKRDNQPSASKLLMKQNGIIEQVVFLEDGRIQTMGNELCINGSFAGAYLSQKTNLELSGLNNPVKFSNNLIINKIKNVVLLQGIVYSITNDKTKINKVYLKKLTDQYNVPASGIIRFRSKKITPIVYVKATNSLVWENACGSGSLAYSIYSNFTKIIQPSGKVVVIKKNLKTFTIKVPIKIVE